MLLLPLVAARDNCSTGWFLVTAPIYYTFYTRDLFRCGYSWIDLPRVYALNLLLVPVSVNGLINSIRQWWTGRKPIFQRTPKIRERTAMPASYIAVMWLIPPTTLAIAILDLMGGGFSIALLGVVNAVLLAIAVVQFVGPRESLEDLHTMLFHKPQVTPSLKRPGYPLPARESVSATGSELEPAEI